MSSSTSNKKTTNTTSNEDAQIIADAMMDESVIAGYLASHPDFFNRHTELLANLQVPHQAGAASLIERQIAVLRDKSRDLEEQLNGLIRTARGNEQIVTRLQRFTLELMRANDINDVIATCQDVLRDDFNADYVSIRIIDKTRCDGKAANEEMDTKDNDSLHFINPKDKNLKQFGRLFDSKKPVCGRLKQEQQSFLFGDNAEEIKSVALIPLSGAEKMGILALGSHDETRFHPGMGTVFISHLGELVTTSLARYRNP